MKKLVNVYSYETEIKLDRITDDIDIEKNKAVTYTSATYVKDYMKAEHPKRSYKTKMLPSDLPHWYCDVKRYGSNRECINAKGITDMKYTWVKENHFMKDSVLRISYSGKLEPYKEEFDYDGKHYTSIFTDYRNLDGTVFEYDIFKFIGYAKMYSNFDITDIKNEFIKQCEWLKENKPEFAPNADDFGKWFDERIEIGDNYVVADLI